MRADARLFWEQDLKNGQDATAYRSWKQSPLQGPRLPQFECSAVVGKQEKEEVELQVPARGCE